MAVEWQVVGSGGADPHVIASFYAQDDGRWRRFVSSACGVASAVRGDVSGGANGALEAELPAKQRSLSLLEAYHALAVDRLLDGPRGMEHYWNWFSTLSADFQTQFVVYQHFRRLDWRVKSGLNYGAHYVLYRGSAAKFHSEYIVYVQTTGGSVDAAASSSSWNVIQALTRVAADVKKTVLLCEVTTSLAPSEPSDVDEHSPSLTYGSYEFHGRRFSVDAVAIRFWDVGDAALHAADATADAFDFHSQSMILKNEPSKATSKRRQDKATSIVRKKPKAKVTSSAAHE